MGRSRSLKCVYSVLDINALSPSSPAECDVDGQFVDFPLVRQALALVRLTAQPVISWDYGVFEAFSASLQSDKSLRHACGVVG